MKKPVTAARGGGWQQPVCAFFRSSKTAGGCGCFDYI
jgi:hypothetical protein